MVSINTVSTDVKAFSVEQVKSKQVEIPVKESNITEKQVSIKSDNFKVGVKTGIVPTLKGAGAGLGGGTVIAVGVIASGVFKDASMPAGIAFIVGGLVGGAVSANMTESKSKGAYYGSVGGAITGAVVGTLATGGHIGIGAAAGVIGGLAGGAGGFFGSLVAKQK